MRANQYRKTMTAFLAFFGLLAGMAFVVLSTASPGGAMQPYAGVEAGLSVTRFSPQADSVVDVRGEDPAALLAACGSAGAVNVQLRSSDGTPVGDRVLVDRVQGGDNDFFDWLRAAEAAIATAEPPVEIGDEITIDTGDGCVNLSVTVLAPPDPGVGLSVSDDLTVDMANHERFGCQDPDFLGVEVFEVYDAAGNQVALTNGTDTKAGIPGLLEQIAADLRAHTPAIETGDELYFAWSGQCDFRGASQTVQAGVAVVPSDASTDSGGLLRPVILLLVLGSLAVALVARRPGANPSSSRQ